MALINKNGKIVFKGNYNGCNLEEEINKLTRAEITSKNSKEKDIRDKMAEVEKYEKLA